MKRCRRALALAIVLATSASLRADADWRETLTPAAPGKFPALSSMDLEYSFGWSNIVESARAHVSLQTLPDRHRVKVTGETVGLARALWPLDAWHLAVIDRSRLHPISLSQHEEYRNRTIHTDLRFDAEGVNRLRSVTPADKAAKWKRINFAPLFDLLGAVLFVRSGPLRDGDEIRLVAFPGDSPYLATLRVEGRDTVTCMGRDRKAIRLSLDVRKLEVKDRKPERPVRYAKFRSGRFWISDDELRLPLRAEVNVFVGFVYGELIGYKIR